MTKGPSRTVGPATGGGSVDRGGHQSQPAGLTRHPAHEYADRQFYRAITDDAFLLSDPTTDEIVFSFPLPMVALNV